MTELRPGTSPPPVRMPIRLFAMTIHINPVPSQFHEAQPSHLQRGRVSPTRPLKLLAPLTRAYGRIFAVGSSHSRVTALACNDNCCFESPWTKQVTRSRQTASPR